MSSSSSSSSSSTTTTNNNTNNNNSSDNNNTYVLVKAVIPGQVADEVESDLASDGRDIMYIYI